MDIALLPVDPNLGYFADIAIDGADLKIGSELQSGLMLSLYIDARATVDDGIALNSDPRGWWADTYNKIANDLNGSKLWLLQRSKQTTQTLGLAKDYVTSSLKWLIDDGVAQSVDVATLIIRTGVMLISINVTRPQGLATFNYEYVWNGV